MVLRRTCCSESGWYWSRKHARHLHVSRRFWYDGQSMVRIPFTWHGLWKSHSSLRRGKSKSLTRSYRQSRRLSHELEWRNRIRSKQRRLHQFLDWLATNRGRQIFLPSWSCRQWESRPKCPCYSWKLHYSANPSLRKWTNDIWGIRSMVGWTIIWLRQRIGRCYGICRARNRRFAKVTYQRKP